MLFESSHLVYSTETGVVKPGPKKPGNDGLVRVRLDTKYRKGKAVTLITGVPLSNNALLELAKSLKQKFGTGGTAKNGRIELQGDHREAVVEELKKQEFKVKVLG